MASFIYCVLVLFLGGALKGVVGLGLPLVGVPLLTFPFGLKEAVSILDDPHPDAKPNRPRVQRDSGEARRAQERRGTHGTNDRSGSAPRARFLGNHGIFSTTISQTSWPFPCSIALAV